MIHLTNNLNQRDLFLQCVYCSVADEDGGGNRKFQPKMGPKQPVLFLPPPPEHPPPSDIGTPPDSPTNQRASPPMSRMSDCSGRYGHVPMRNPMMHSSDHMASHDDPGQFLLHNPVPYSDSEYGTRTANCHPDHRAFSPRSSSERRTQSPRGCAAGPGDGAAPQQSPPNRAPSPKCRTMSPRTHLNMRAYSPRAMSEPERGPTPPVRAYKLIPLKDHELQRHYSDGEAAPMPPIRMIGHNPPSPAPEDPMMDRACQSSLPSLVSECVSRWAEKTWLYFCFI